MLQKQRRAAHKTVKGIKHRSCSCLTLVLQDAFPQTKAYSRAIWHHALKLNPFFPPCTKIAMQATTYRTFAKLWNCGSSYFASADCSLIANPCLLLWADWKRSAWCQVRLDPGSRDDILFFLNFIAMYFPCIRERF